MTSKVSYRSKTDLVADAIRSMIEGGELEPGTELHQREVADLLGVSPTPVREAMRRLEAEGFISIEPHQPAVVVRPDNAELYESAVILGTLEALGAELAAKKITREDISDLVDLNRKLASATTLAEGSALDRQFHFRVCEISGSPVLLTQLNLLRRSMGESTQSVGDMKDWITEHDEIIEALAAGDCSVARDATNSHVLEAFSRYAPSEA
ncbi:MAG: GntR family transcriptional regulator [Acidimicrobiia bacterium]